MVDHHIDLDKIELLKEVDEKAKADKSPEQTDIKKANQALVDLINFIRNESKDVFRQRAQALIAKDMNNLMDKLTEEHAKTDNKTEEGVHRATFWMDSALKIDHIYSKETEKKLFVKEKIEGKKYADDYKHFEEKDIETEHYDEKFEEGYIFLNKDKLEFRLSAKDKYLTLPDK